MGSLARRASQKNVEAINDFPAALLRLRRIRHSFRPIHAHGRPPLGEESSQFSAPLRQTIADLDVELTAVGAEAVVIEVDVEERFLRIDGRGVFKSAARLESGAAGISFESRYGPMRFATGQHLTVPENLRAIVLTMRALRAVDRYGVAASGEQYQGFKAIPRTTGPSDPATVIPDRAAALRLLAQWGGDVRRALRETHPDAGGTAEQFALVTRARELVEA